MKIAVEGCCHDMLEVIYDTVNLIERRKNITIDLLLICGDFQATRNLNDLQCMAIPPNYRDMKYFYKYYKGEKKAPILTVIIGGNHEASNHMQELPYGGWLAPNIYYLGYAGVIKVGSLRIGGMSGIYKGRDYHKGHFEKPPYSNDDMRSCYHVRSLEVFRLKQIHSHVDIMMSHDWPLHAVHAGNVNALLKWKPDFEDEINSDALGNPAAQEVMDHLKPTYWFSAHLHCKYPARIQHKGKEGEEKKITNFLALDKCLPRRKFLQVLDIPNDSAPPYKIELDPEWLVILKNTNHLLNLTSSPRYMPGVGCKERYDFSVTTEEKNALLEDFGGDLSLPENFEMTVVPYDGVSRKKGGHQPPCQVNPQTTLLCQMLGLTDPFAVFTGQSVTDNPDEIDISQEDDDETTDTQESQPASQSASPSRPDQDAVKSSQNDAESVDTDASHPETGGTPNETFSEEFPTFINSNTPLSASRVDGSVSTSLVESSASPIIKPAKTSAASAERAGHASTDTHKRLSTDMEQTTPNPEADEISPAMKRFKRRNIAMYSIQTQSQDSGGENSNTN